MNSQPSTNSALPEPASSRSPSAVQQPATSMMIDRLLRQAGVARSFAANGANGHAKGCGHYVIHYLLSIG